MIAVVSAHLDDAALALGSTLCLTPGPYTVVTVFAGRPADYGPIQTRKHDMACRFDEGDDVVGLRRREDATAWGPTGNRVVHLDFVEAQYRPPHPDDHLADAIAGELDGLADRYYAPAGFGHKDHRATALGCMRLAAPVDWYVEPSYADVEADAYVSWSRMLVEKGWLLDTRDVDVPLKLALLGHYRSQLRAFPALALWLALRKERIWRAP